MGGVDSVCTGASVSKKLVLFLFGICGSTTISSSASDIQLCTKIKMTYKLSQTERMNSI